jgi:hypothetical protein
VEVEFDLSDLDTGHSSMESLFFGCFAPGKARSALGDGTSSVEKKKSYNTLNRTRRPHRNIHKYTWTPPDGKTHNQIDHILVDRRRHSNVLDARSFRGADCDSDHYLMVAKVRERLAVNKHAISYFAIP